MPIVHADLLKDPFVFNSDRNNWMSGGGVHSWSLTPGVAPTYNRIWTFTEPIVISWFAGRSTGFASHQGSATYNTIPATAIPMPLDSVAYVTLDPSANAALAIQVSTGGTLPSSDNIFVLASYRDIGLVADNPLQMRWGNCIAPGQNYNAAIGTPTIGYSTTFPAQWTWVVNHPLASANVIVQCYHSATTPANQIFPQTIEITDINTVTITWSSAVPGRVVVMKAA